ncbi:hypothetical protein GBA52_021434 [Prunus armeniaca]|nr:hypothetical protein GBA52_021434 [Prunus armeniaca]
MAVERDPLIWHGPWHQRHYYYYFKAKYNIRLDSEHLCFSILPTPDKRELRVLAAYVSKAHTRRTLAIPCPANPSYELRPPKISGVFRKINGPDFWLADSSKKKIVEDRYRGDFESGEDERNSLEMGPTPTGYIFI